MDWCPGMATEKGKKPAASPQPPDREEIQRIVSGQLSSDREKIVTDVVAALERNKGSTSKWNRPWVIAIGGTIVGGLLVWGIGAFLSHNAQDLKRDITMEVTAQLVPIQDKLQKMAEDIAKIKGADGIAQGSAPSLPGSALQKFAKMDQAELSHQLAKVADAVSEAQKKGAVVDNLDSVAAVQKTLSVLPLDTPDAIRATSAIINYASFVREKKGLFPNVETVRAKPCQFINLGDGPINVIRFEVARATLGGCGQRPDGLSLKDVTFQNAILTYNGGAIVLENVTFINCLFVISLPSRPSGPAKRFASELLARNIGPNPRFTASVG